MKLRKFTFGMLVMHQQSRFFEGFIVRESHAFLLWSFWQVPPVPRSRCNAKYCHTSIAKWEVGSTSHEKMLYGFCILRKINIQYASEGREAYFFSDRSILVLNAKKASTEMTN